MATPIPQNRAGFTAEEVLAATGGTLLTPDRHAVRGVATDTRGDLDGKLFVALAGERFDGHDFVAAAVAAGAAGVLVERDVTVPPGVLVVRVRDTLRALGDLAHWHRARWGGTVLAVGGSAGKTTTRAVISALARAALGDAVGFQRGNLNNRVGVPMVLLTAVPEQRLMVVEVGTNALGEIPLLTAIVAPDAAVLTLIDLEHTEGLGDLDGIEAEEGALLAALAPNAVAVGNVDDPRVRRRLAASPAQRKVGYGTADDAAYRIVARSLRGSAGSRVSVRRPDGTVAEATASLLGLPGALAVTAGLAVVESVLGRALTPAELSAALAGDDAREPGRLTPVELADGTLVLDDTYNANPGSMSSSVAAARELAHERGARLVLVLGEMRELGARSPEEHHRLGATLKAVEPALVVGVGGDAARLVAAARSTGVRADFAADVAAAAPLLRAGLRPGDVVLIKASRGLRAERLVTDLLGTSGGAA